MGVDQKFVVNAPSEDISSPIELHGARIEDGFNLGPFAIDKQKFGIVTKFPEGFFPMCGNVDGVIGLAKGGSLLDQLLNGLPNGVISFYMNGLADDYKIGDNRRLGRIT